MKPKPTVIDKDKLYDDFEVANILQEFREEIKEKIEKMKVKIPAGKCPYCKNGNPTLTGGAGHFREADEHYFIYNVALDDILKQL